MEITQTYKDYRTVLRTGMFIEKRLDKLKNKTDLRLAWLIYTTLFILLATAMSAFAETQEETIARVIAAEACGEGYRGMELVAMTILNRAKLREKTPYEIVTQKSQYYGLTASNSKRLYLLCKKDADEIVDQLVSGKLKDQLDGAIYFRRPDEPMFRWCKVETGRHKNHVFYR